MKPHCIHTGFLPTQAETEAESRMLSARSAASYLQQQLVEKHEAMTKEQVDDIEARIRRYLDEADRQAAIIRKIKTEGERVPAQMGGVA